jgi:hypothetical protein
MQLLHCLLLSCVSWNQLTVAPVAISTEWPGWTWSATFERPWENFSAHLWTTYVTHTSHSKQEIFLCEYPLHWVLLPTKEKRMTILLIGSILLEHGCQFDYWNQLLNMCMQVFYLDCHEAELFCYLAIQIEDLLCLLQPIYFHLWPTVYCLSLLYGECISTFTVC